MKGLIIGLVLGFVIISSTVMAQTNIILQEADLENMEDTYIRSDWGVGNLGTAGTFGGRNDTAVWYALVKFNITSIPAGQVIEDAIFTARISNNRLDSAAEGFNVSAHDLQNQTWIETYITWDKKGELGNWNQTKESDYLFFGGAGEPINIFINWSVKNMVTRAYNDGDENITVFLRSHGKFGTPSSDWIEFLSKETGTAAQRPYLNITYSEAPPEPASPMSNDLIFKYMVNNFTTVWPEMICWLFFGDNDFCIGNDTIYGSEIVINESLTINDNLTCNGFIIGDGSLITGIDINLNDTDMRIGNANITDRIFLADGTSSLPSLTFSSDPDSGIYWGGTFNDPTIVNDGDVIATVGSTNLRITAGSQATPGLVVNDADCGFYSTGNGKFGMACDDEEYWFVFGTQSGVKETMIFNDDGFDMDFRFESDNEERSIALNGSTGNIDFAGGLGSTGITIYDNGNMSMDGDFLGNQIYGEMWNYSANATAWTFPIAAAGTYYNLTNLTAGFLNGFTVTNANQSSGGSYLTAQVAGLYKLEGQVSFQGVAAGGLYGFGFVHGFDVETHRNCYSRRVGTGNTGSVTVTCFMDVVVGDNINIQIEDEVNPPKDIKIHTVNMNMIRIGD